MIEIYICLWSIFIYSVFYPDSKIKQYTFLNCVKMILGHLIKPVYKRQKRKKREYMFLVDKWQCLINKDVVDKTARLVLFRYCESPLSNGKIKISITSNEWMPTVWIPTVIFLTWYRFSCVENGGLNMVLFLAKPLTCMKITQHSILLKMIYEQNRQT